MFVLFLYIAETASFKNNVNFICRLPIGWWDTAHFKGWTKFSGW